MQKTSWYRGLCKKLRTPRLPPTVRPSDKLLGFGIVLSLIIAFSQGLDYAVRPPESVASLSIVESKISLTFWGLVFITFAMISLVGMVFEFWPAAILGHGVLAVNYLAIGSGVIWSLVDDWQGWGWNTGVIYLCFGIFHSLVSDGCYDEWVREWKVNTVPIEIADEDFNGRPHA